MSYAPQPLKERQTQMYEALHDAADALDGNVTSLARELHCSTQWLYKNARRGEFTPDLAKRIEEITGVPRLRFNPRVFS